MDWRSGIRSYVLLAALVVASGLAGTYLGWTAFGHQIDQYAYDFLFRLEPPTPWVPSSIVLALDERTLTKYGGLIGMREALADGLERIHDARPAVVAVDLILAEPGIGDNRLEAAFAQTHGIPVGETQAGKSSLATRHPMNMGAIGVTGLPTPHDEELAKVGLASFPVAARPAS